MITKIIIQVRNSVQSTFWNSTNRWHCSLFLFIPKEAVFVVVIEIFFLGIKKINVTFTGLRIILKVKQIILSPIKGCLNSKYGRGWRGEMWVGIVRAKKN